MSKLYADLQHIPGIKSCYAFGSTHHVTIDPNKLTVSELQNRLAGLSHSNIEITPIEASIEDCFMAIN